MFKIVTKIIVDRLALVTSKIISLNQFGFFKRRNVKDCIVSAFECVNLLKMHCFGGNMAVKIEIHKAFETLD